jgi:hypothetical protein
MNLGNDVTSGYRLKIFPRRGTEFAKGDRPKMCLKIPEF